MKKRLGKVMMFAVLLMFIPVLSAHVAQATSTLTNTDFETYTGSNGVADGWTKVDTPSVTDNVYLVSTPVASGSQAQYISGSGISIGGVVLINQIIDVQANKVFNLNAKFNVISLNNAKAQLYVDYFSLPNGDYKGFISSKNTDLTTTTSGYVTVQNNGTIPVNAVSARIYAVLKSTADNASGAFYVDSMDFTTSYPISISTDGRSVGAIKSDGNRWVWDENGYGQFGMGLRNGNYFPNSHTNSEIWNQVDYGIRSAGGIKSDGTLWTWGYQGAGALGNGQYATINVTTPVNIGTGTDWAKVNIGYQNGLALKTDGSLWSWGYNNFGEVGNGSSSFVGSPTRIGTGNNWVKIFTAFQSSFGIKADATLWAWGRNANSELGIGTYTNQSSPVQIGTASNWVDISSYYGSTAGVQSDGTLWLWGASPYGSYTTPTKIGSDTNWLQVSVGRGNLLAVKTNGTLWAVGDNFQGQLGLGDSINRSVLTQVGTNTDWSVVYTAEWISIALKTDGSVWEWGYVTGFTFGEYVQGQTTPAKVIELTNLSPPSNTTGLIAISGDGEVMLNWTANTDPDIAFYLIYENGVQYEVVTKYDTSITITRDHNGLLLNNGTVYNFQIKAADSGWNESSLSSQVFATPKSHISSLSNLTISQGTLSPAFSSSITNYTVSESSGVYSVTLTPTKTNAAETITVNGITVISGQASSPINLNQGSNVINIIATAEDGATTTYTVNVSIPYDTTPPSAVTDLSNYSTTDSSMSIKWTAPGDDGNTFTAATYDIRYSTSTITEVNWSSATSVSGEPIPTAPGTIQNYTMFGLSSNTTYYFAIKTTDHAANVSSISNIASKTTAASTYSANLIPTMTSNTAPTGTASASSIISTSYDAFQAFDKNNDTIWYSNTNVPQWIAYDFGTATVVNKYTIRAYTGGSNQPNCLKSWTFEGWDGSNWIVLDSATNHPGWSAHELRSYPIPNSTPYQKYRVNITANQGGPRVLLEEIEMMVSQ